MKTKLRLLRTCAQRRNWRGVRFIAKTITLAILWPFCPKCGQFGWFGGSRCCWLCQMDNLFRALSEGDAALDALAKEGK